MTDESFRRPSPSSRTLRRRRPGPRSASRSSRPFYPDAALASAERLMPEPTGSLRIVARLEEYSFGRVTVDGSEQTRDLIVLPDRVVTDWWRREGHSLAMEDLDQVLGELPERLILGVGAYGRLHPDP